MYGFKGVSEKYGITVESEGYHFNWYRDKSMETFKIYSADGVCWEKGLSRRGVKRECEEWAEQLLSIKRKVNSRRANS